jgi:hypothetical protein
MILENDVRRAKGAFKENKVENKKGYSLKGRFSFYKSDRCTFNRLFLPR